LPWVELVKIQIFGWNKAVAMAVHELSIDVKAMCIMMMDGSMKTEKEEKMAVNIFVNLPVSDLDRSAGFFSRLGFSFDPMFTDETATCMIVSDTIFVMLLTEEKFRSFIPNGICDARKSTEVLVCLSVESPERVDEMVRIAVGAGGNTYNEPQDYGFMYGHGFQDPDGHIWELVFMVPGQSPDQA
jgi:uncharacterized protein